MVILRCIPSNGWQIKYEVVWIRVCIEKNLLTQKVQLNNSNILKEKYLLVDFFTKTRRGNIIINSRKYRQYKHGIKI